MATIISPDSKQWNATVHNMHNFDFYHLAEYSRIQPEGEPVLFVSAYKNETVAIPLIMRPIENSGYYDVTSVYGYAGPIASSQTPSAGAVANFQYELKQFFDNRSVVSVFSRLHPLFASQEVLLCGLGEIRVNGISVCLDLTQTEAEQRRQYSHSLKNIVNRLRKHSTFNIKTADSIEEIETFAEIYRENMQRVKASPMYFFDTNYFLRFLDTLPAKLLLAQSGSETVCGSMFTECNGIIQPHLSATLNRFLHHSPLKMVWDEIRLYGTRNNFCYMHLGGGLGGRTDSLFDFKAQFSHTRLTFKTWRYIHNQDAYAALIAKRFGKSAPESDFFPKYRGGD
jgi:hypothetical protein